MILSLQLPTCALLFTLPKIHNLDAINDLAAILAFYLPWQFNLLPELNLDLFTSFSINISHLIIINLAFFLFTIVRLLDFGYTFKKINLMDLIYASSALALYTTIAIPLGKLTNFIEFKVTNKTAELIIVLLKIYFAIAIREEFFFRGVIQNLLETRIESLFPPKKDDSILVDDDSYVDQPMLKEKTFLIKAKEFIYIPKSALIALIIASVLFGASHLDKSTVNHSIPNFMYMLMASLAGLAYGWTWRKSNKITVSAFVHAAVDFIWYSILGGD